MEGNRKRWKGRERQRKTKEEGRKRNDVEGNEVDKNILAAPQRQPS
jgi:hypothetical protein